MEQKAHATGNKKFIDFLDILLEAKDEDGTGLTNEEIRDQVNTFLFAGHDTTASGLSWFLFNMARHPTYQDKCYEEVRTVLVDDHVTWSDLKQLEYLTLCIKESLRLHPPVCALTRRPDQPFTLSSGVVVPGGVTTGLFIYGLHHNSSVWKNAWEFDPERFTPENTANRPAHAFLPFSTGPRNCIGQHFALAELKTNAALLLRHFKFSIGDNPEPVKVERVTLGSANGIWLQVEERK